MARKTKIEREHLKQEEAAVLKRLEDKDCNLFYFDIGQLIALRRAINAELRWRGAK